jgi:hypothetical protein
VADGRAAMGGGQEGRDGRQTGGPSGGQEGRDGRRTAATDGRAATGGRQEGRDRRPPRAAMQRWRAHGRQLADGGGSKKTGSGGCRGDAPHPNPTCSDSMLPWKRR